MHYFWTPDDTALVATMTRYISRGGVPCQHAATVIACGSGVIAPFPGRDLDLGPGPGPDLDPDRDRVLTTESRRVVVTGSMCK